MFGFRRYPEPNVTPGSGGKSHSGQTQTLDDGTVLSRCTCGWSATARGEDVHPDPHTLLSNHIASA